MNEGDVPVQLGSATTAVLLINTHFDYHFLSFRVFEETIPVEHLELFDEYVP